jgi:hypothetical protein
MVREYLDMVRPNHRNLRMLTGVSSIEIVVDLAATNNNKLRSLWTNQVDFFLDVYAFKQSAQSCLWIIEMELLDIYGGVMF